MTTNIERVAREIVDNYGWVADRDVNRAEDPLTAEEVFDWYSQEACDNGLVSWEETGEVQTTAARIWRESK